MIKRRFAIVIAHTTHDLDGLGATLRVVASQISALSGLGVSSKIRVVNASDDPRLESFVGPFSRKIKMDVTVSNVTDLQTMTERIDGFAILVAGDLPGKEMFSLCFQHFNDAENSKYLTVRPKVEYHFFEQDFKHYSDLGLPSWSARSHFRIFDHETDALTSSGLASVVDFWSGTMIVSRHTLLEHVPTLSTSNHSLSTRSIWIRAFSSAKVRHEYVEGAFVAVRN